MKNKRNYCTFYIVRHGETEWNKEGIIQGQSDSALTSLGIQQAKELAKALRDIKFDHVYSSDLLRAKKTAEIFAGEHKILVATTKLLRERRFGRLQGRKAQEVKKELAQEFKKMAALKKEDRFRHRLIKDYETDEEVTRRLITFLRESAILFNGKRVLIVTHGGVMRTFLVYLGYAEYYELTPGTISNTGYIIIDSDGTEFIIKKVSGVNKRSAYRHDLGF